MADVLSPGRVERSPVRQGTPLAMTLTVVSWAALIVFTLGSVGSALLGRSVFMSTQTLEGFVPWASLDPAPVGTPVTNQWLGDTLDAVTPGMLLHQRSLAEGEFVQWDPYVAGGAASASLPDDAAFSPLSLPWYLLPATYAPGAVKVLEIAAVTVGMSLLLRRFRLPSASWALSSLIYSSSAFMVAWTNWPQTRVAAMVPLLFWAVERVVTGRRWCDLVPLAVVVATMLAGGFPAVTGFAAYAVGCYAVARALWVTRVPRELARAAAVLVTGLVAGFGLVAWQMLPFVHQAMNVVDFSVRQQTPSSHLEWGALATAVVPEVYGGPVGQFWGLARNPIETFSYVSAAGFALVLVALAVRPGTRERRFLRGFVLAGLAFSTALVYVGGFPLGLLQQLPVFSNNSIGRVTVLVGFFAALAAGIGFGLLVEPGRDTRTAIPGWRAAPRLVGALVVVVAMAVTVGEALTEVPPEHWAAVRAAAVRGALYLGATGTLATVALWGRHTVARAAVAVVVPVLVLVPALAVAAAWWPKGPVEYFYPTTPTHEFLADNLGHDRFISVDWVMLPGTSSAYRLRAANGHTFHTVEWKDLLIAADPDVMVTATYSRLTSGDLATVLASPALDRLAVRYAVLDPEVLLPGTIEQVSTGTDVAVLSGGHVSAAGVTGPLRGVILTLPEGISVGPDGAVVTVAVVGPDGATVASTDRVVGEDRPAGPLWVALAGETLRTGQSVRVDVTVAGAQPMAVAADSLGDIAISVLRPAGDDLRVVATDGATVVERLTALDRIRWADAEVVEQDGREAVALLASGRLPAGTVLLEHAADAGDTAAGSMADVSVSHDGPDVIEASVEADGAGWLVVADSVRGGGWHAYVDGVEVRLVQAEHALGAVAVPDGHHQVRLEYHAPGQRAGLMIAAVTVLGLIALLVRPTPDAVRRRRR